MSYVKHVPGFLSPVTLMPFNSIICSRLNFEKKEEFAVPPVVHSELKRPVCNDRGANEDEVLAVGSSDSSHLPHGKQMDEKLVAPLEDICVQ